MGTTRERGAETVFVGGRWKDADSYREVRNPATGEVVSRQAEAGRGEVRGAIEAAYGALPGWQGTSAFGRSQVLGRVAELLSEREEEIGRVLALETGKLLAEAVGEIRLSVDYFSWFAGEARRLEGLSLVDGRATGPQMVVKKPVGVVASLTPWNFPVSIQARKVAPALAAGCTLVARPSEEAPASVVELWRCMEEAGVPDGVANLVTGPAEITEPLIEDPRVRLVSFTGSTRVGRMLYERSAATMKKLALELGGCAPFVVLEDADLDHAVEQAAVAKLRNCGQSCVGANVFYVQGGLYEPFVERMAEKFRGLKLGDPLAEGTTVGPVINARRREAVEELRDRALAGGFEGVAAAPPLAEDSGLSGDCFFAPELLAAPSAEGVDRGVVETEIFGPLALVVGFEDAEGLVGDLNRNPLGLAGYVFSGDAARAMRMATRLEVGIAGVNEGLASAANMPMGGVKDSGLGREGGHLGMEEFLEPQYVAARGEPFSAWAFGG